MNAKSILIGIVVVIFLGAGAYFLLTGRITITPPESTPQKEKPVSLGAELGAQTENPAASLPETNPFEEAQTNPFEGANTNPFQNTFNPFE